MKEGKKMIFGKNVNRYYKKHGLVYLLGIAALLLVDYMQLKLPEFFKYVINGVNSGSVEYKGETLAFDMNFLLDRICLPLIFVILSLVVGRFLWRVCFFGTAIKVEQDIRLRMFDHSKELSVQFYHTNKVGNMMSLFTNDLDTINECFGDGILMLFDALVLGTMALFKMINMHPLLTLFSLIPMMFLFVAATIVGKYEMKKWEKRQAAFSALSDFSQESFSGISVIKAFVKEGKELSAFRKLSKKNEDINVEYTKLSAGFHVMIELFIGSVICIIIGYGGYLVHKGVFNGGELVEFISYFDSIIWPIMAVSGLIEMKSRGKASLKRIDGLLDAEIDVKDSDLVTETEKFRGGIEFRNLTFRYEGRDCDVLKNVSFSIAAGENVGIIGKTGSGKTTIVDLLLRTYNVPDGTIFIDGKDINLIPIKTVRKYSAYVPQDNFLFSDTIKSNIAFASDSDDSEEVKRAAVLADIDSNIAQFPKGYETVLGEKGVTVSGGQKQRISIARAVMKEASILILDDSVSAVDTATEKVIIENLRENRKGKTTILIAHRISTVEKMDKIIFVDDGEVVAVGTHDELLSSCPDYSKMVELQKLEEEKGEHENV
ncbi:MAG: ABC transporter ATP-binding protein [Acutalibacteraceae bacterium]